MFDAAGERVEARVEVAHPRLERPFDPLLDRRQPVGRRLQRFGAFGAAFEAGRWRLRAYRRCGATPGAGRLARPARLEPRTRAAFVFESVFAPRQAGDLLADRVEPIVAPEIGGIDAALGGSLGDDFVEPLPEIEPGPAGGLFGKNARLAPYARDLPGRRAFHRLARGRPLGNRCAAGSMRRNWPSFPLTW